RARSGTHLYSDKEPGLALIELPTWLALRPGSDPAHWPEFSLRLWGVRVLSVGLCFLVCAFLVGRVGEGLAPGYGGAAMFAFALGTLMAPFAATGFDHVPAAMFAFGSFLLAWHRRALLAGIAAGLAVLTEYEAGIAVLLVGAYIGAHGVRR